MTKKDEMLKDLDMYIETRRKWLDEYFEKLKIYMSASDDPMDFSTRSIHQQLSNIHELQEEIKSLYNTKRMIKYLKKEEEA